MLWLTWRSHDLIQVMWLVENHILQEVSYSLDSDEVMKDIWEPTRNHGNIQKAMSGLIEWEGRRGGGMKKIFQNEQFECQVSTNIYLSIWILQFSLSPWSSGEGRDGGRGTATSQHTQLCVWSEGDKQMTPTGRAQPPAGVMTHQKQASLSDKRGRVCVSCYNKKEHTWSPISRCPSHKPVPCRGTYLSTMFTVHRKHVPDLWPHLCTDTAAVCVAQCAHGPHPHQP